MSAVNVKMSQVIPTGSVAKPLDSKSNRTAQARPSWCRSFGPIGVLVLLVLVICATWTFLLIFLALAPNQAANLIMNTGEYDNGDFWLINDADPQMTLAAVVGLAVVGFCYLVVMLEILWRREKLINKAEPLEMSEGTAKLTNERLRGLWHDVTSFEGKLRKRWNAVLKLVDLAVESVILRQLLSNGSPPSLVYGFAGFLAVNALSCAVNIATNRFSPLTEVFINSIFDLIAAVIFPILTLVYSYYNFHFDRAVFLTYLEELPPGSFELLARTFANPSEIALFLVNFDSLRIHSLSEFAVRISVNLVFCYRCKRILEVLVRNRHHAKYDLAAQIPVPKTVVIVFVAISLAVLLSTHKAVSDSESICSPHPECVVYAHQWSSKDEHCPCLILIDIDLAPKTYDEWMNPVDAFGKVAALAASGKLTSLQVINRQLLEFPEELRLCRGLKTIQLIYTSTQQLPSWVTELKNLETIQIEGKYGWQNLVQLPEDLFSDLPQLALFYLGLHESLKRVPPLTGVPRLRAFSLAWVPQLTELPAFDHIPGLNRLRLVLALRLNRMPDMSPLKNLVEFVIIRPTHLCCNGFVGDCDLSQSSCSSNSMANSSEATCLVNASNPSLPATPFLGNQATKLILEKFASTICYPTPFDQVGFSTFPTEETIEMCEGIPFKQCYLPGNVTGICFNTRQQVLSCLTDQKYIALRRLQIERHVGPKCDPVEEKWLGCR